MNSSLNYSSEAYPCRIEYSVYCIGSLYVVSYVNGVQEPIQLTNPNQSHVLKFGFLDGNGYFVDQACSLQQSSSYSIYKVTNGTKAEQILQLSSGSKADILPVKPPEIFPFENQLGLTSYGAIYHSQTNNSPSPTLLYIYGGPHVQLVSNDFEKMFNRKFYSYTFLGYNVVLIDGVGSHRRGLEFEGPLKFKMGLIEIKDQVTGLQVLINKGLVDPKKIVITGWSYGGYMSLMGLAQRPDIFAYSISCAPVSSWKLYDTGYTERYMGLLSEHQEDYELTSVMKFLDDKFPDDRLTLVHGMIDENVHFNHSTFVIEKLCSLKKMFDLCIYPKERHGIRTLSNYEHFDRKVERILLSIASKN